MRCQDVSVGVPGFVAAAVPRGLPAAGPERQHHCRRHRRPLLPRRRSPVRHGQSQAADDDAEVRTNQITRVIPVSDPSAPFIEKIRIKDYIDILGR